MINEANILVCASSSGNPSDPDRIAAIAPMVDSSTKQGISVQIFWTGQPFDSYFNAKLKNLRTNLDSVGPQYTHILYVDSHDILFLTPLSEILQAYDALGDPNFLMLGDTHQSPKDVDLSLNINTSGYRFPNDGIFIGNINVIKNQLDVIIQRVGQNIYINPKTIFRTLLSEGSLLPQHIDSNCNIFQSLNGLSYTDIILESNKIKNSNTGTFPKILHADNSMHHPMFQKIYNFAINDNTTGITTLPDYVVGIVGATNLRNKNSGTSYLNWDIGRPNEVLIMSKKQLQYIVSKPIDLINVELLNGNPFLRSWISLELPNARINIEKAGVLESFTVLVNSTDVLACQGLCEYNTLTDRVSKITIKYFDMNRNLLYQTSSDLNLAIDPSSAYFI